MENNNKSKDESQQGGATGVICVITNTLNGKQYVGKTFRQYESHFGAEKA